MNTIVWDFVQKVTESEITIVEKTLNISFPEDFKKIVLSFNGGYPTPNSFDIPNKRKGLVFSNLLSFDSKSRSYIIKKTQILHNILPTRYIPFGMDPYGNYLCFQYDGKNLNPSIVFYDHEEDISSEENFRFVTDSFTHLIEMLYGYDSY